MAAVLPFLEAPPSEAEIAEAGTALAGLGEAANKPKKVATDANGFPLPVLAKPHSELTNLMWTRAAILRELSTLTMTVERTPLPHIHPQAAKYFIRLSKPLSNDVVPWWGISQGRMPEGTELFSDNSKMRCPTFDLPAGSSVMGGACPGAISGQSVVPPATRLKSSQEVRDHSHRYNLATGRLESGHYDLDNAICEYCYATGGKFSEASVQIKQLIMFGFIRRMVDSNPQALKQILFEATLGAESFFKSKTDKTARFNILPVRVHSSGDFYTIKYAEIWIDVAWMLLANEKNGGRAVRLWAPTRTHVNEGFRKFWAKTKVPMNFAIRPSAWHVGDVAPAPVAWLHDLAPQPAGQYRADGAKVPLYVEGTSDPLMVQGTSVLRASVAPLYAGKAYDFQCGTYALDPKEGKSCALSASPVRIGPQPDGVPSTSEGQPKGADKDGCRACWIRPDLRVNYAFH